jgi:chorismate mutase/prephenate dehydratase
MKNSRVAFLGPLGSFSHRAMLAIFGEHVCACPLESPRQVVAAVADLQDAVTHAVVPIDNAVCGIIEEVAQLIEEHPVAIADRHEVTVDLCLIGCAQPRRIYSKREVFAQCKQWLARKHPDIPCIEAASSSAAVARLAEDGDEHAAAIGSALAASLYDLPVMEADIADIRDNRTAFVVLVPQPGGPEAVVPKL